MSKEELVFKVKGSGCKMLDGLDFDRMNMSEICTHLKKSCCPALKDLIKEAQKNLYTK